VTIRENDDSGGAAMAQRYKPAICHGQPCEMVCPIAIESTQRL
jgi:hypothetical protein